MKTQKVIQDHIRPPLCQNHSSNFVRMQISWNNIKIYVIEKFCDFFFTWRPSDLNTTLTYILMDNFWVILVVWDLKFYYFLNNVITNLLKILNMQYLYTFGFETHPLTPLRLSIYKFFYIIILIFRVGWVDGPGVNWLVVGMVFEGGGVGT